MSIFDVIKYPITEDFNLEDLRRIPYSVLNNWWYLDIMKVARFRNIAARFSPHPEEICRMAIYVTPDEAKYLRPMCMMLRKRIEEL